MDTPKTLLEAVKYFADPDRCVAYLAERRWPNGVACPRCGDTHVRFDSKRRVWECNSRHPRRQFSVKVDTIFEDSPIGLDKWLPCVWQIVGCKNGVSSYEIHRALGVTQKTAWFMLHRVRLSMQAKDGGKLGGEVEVDETFIGAKARNMHESRKKALGVHRGLNPGKVAVMGLLQRHTAGGKSKVRASVIPDTKRERLHGKIASHVAEGSRVYTDEFPAYQDMPDTFEHNVIRHAEAYVDGQVHTNGIENFWSLLKRTLNGTYVSVEPFHLFRYLDEQAFRFNERGGNDADRFEEAIRGIVGRRIMYKTLTAHDDRPESL
jgi:transposase-like protein